MHSLDYLWRRIEERRNATVLRALGLMTKHGAKIARQRRQLKETVRSLGEMVFTASPVTIQGPSPLPEAEPLVGRLSGTRWRVREEAAKEARALPHLDQDTTERLVDLLKDEQWLVARAALFALLAHQAVDPLEDAAVKELLEGPHKEAFDLDLLRRVA